MKKIVVLILIISLVFSCGGNDDNSKEDVNIVDESSLIQLDIEGFDITDFSEIEVLTSQSIVSISSDESFEGKYEYNESNVQ